MSPEVYEESLTTLFSVGSKRAELLSNYERLSKLKLREDCRTFSYFVF